MNPDITALIHDYKREFEELEEILRMLNERYTPTIDVEFKNLYHVNNFMSLLNEEITPSTFVTFDNRCQLCPRDWPGGHWAFVDEQPLTVGLVFELCIYLKNNGILCPHEKLTSIAVTNIFCRLILNGSEIPQTETEPS